MKIPGFSSFKAYMVEMMTIIVDRKLGYIFDFSKTANRLWVLVNKFQIF